MRGARGGWAARAAAAALAVAAALVAAACGGGAEAGERPRVAVTTPILAAVVREAVGERAEVVALMPDGADPHDVQPSARDAEALRSADLVVQNGLGLEEGMVDLVRRAAEDGVPVLTVTDHVAPAEGPPGDGGHPHGEGSHREDEGHDHGPEDPHVWMDPLAMRDAVGALEAALRREAGLDVAASAARLRARLEALDREIAARLRAVPAGRRTLVTGHDSMGRFAERYGFEVVGTIVPSLSSQAQASAGDLARLREQVARAGVPAIIAETGTSPDVARAVADATGARVVEVATHTLPEDGSYLTYMRLLAGAVAEALGG